MFEVKIFSFQIVSEVFSFFLWFLFLGGCFVRNCFASIPSFDLPSFSIPQTVADALVQVIGLNMDHRSYQPATALGTQMGLDIGIETTLVQPPQTLGQAIGSLAGSVSSMSGGGGSSSSSSDSSSLIPVIPSIKFHIHKGIGSKVDLGFSILPPIPYVPYFGNTFLAGGDIKVVVWDPEEGPTVAVRASYNINSVDVTVSGVELSVKTATITPQLLISKKLGFADPYMGVGYQYTYGSMLLTIQMPSLPPPLPSVSPLQVAQNGSGAGTFFFGGLSMKVPIIGFKITLEGAYSPIGMNYLGSKIGFEF